jgi:hypothetical protein
MVLSDSIAKIDRLPSEMWCNLAIEPLTLYSRRELTGTARQDGSEVRKLLSFECATKTGTARASSQAGHNAVLVDGEDSGGGAAAGAAGNEPPTAQRGRRQH